MGQKYSQLSLNERRTIYRMRGDGHKPNAIGKALGRHHSTIYREIARNRTQETETEWLELQFSDYFPVTANGFSARRRQRLRKLERDTRLRQHVLGCLQVG